MNIFDGFQRWPLFAASLAPFWESLPDFLTIPGRAILVYIVGLIIIRLGKNRLLGRTTAFDIVLAFILGSLFSRAINGTAPVAGTVSAGLTLVALHWLIALVSSRSEAADHIVKGPLYTLIRNGELHVESMKKAEVSRSDLAEALRLQAGVNSIEDVELSCVERNGEISVVPRRPVPEVLEIDVEDGVQRVRIELV